ncbi:hypothetical protein UFOVP1188_14 [uncultured Caudovirales phage]|uniref:Uncharacterized protein n=1 Tax=uncultured Caudovirales phage TaxID=2100421 RepID=A0A6J5QBZ6_9CAUD|nr:hypothetical protein UFOVP1029_14 [uncultured Caudovirales phage]CAB4185079.1 hypothetical protein UFOVP1129_14 [uncultured Caudovirales phage]CAB4189339.1 hypothetical protein UFOVP1188_14 [uncultured Caudovirales phage]CAB4217482.1 hypothetical protein UFOVP1490_33 [uncultured Caudovirales phage]CAB4220376.1 hypothetical protein UFOVP1633_14 [uncultured Caudovirales phage]
MKPVSLTPAKIVAMIDEINEHITAVTPATVWDVTATVFDSIAPGAFWADTEKEITHGEITAIVEGWISDNAPAPMSELDAYKSVPLAGVTRNWEF